MAKIDVVAVDDRCGHVGSAFERAPNDSAIRRSIAAGCDVAARIRSDNVDGRFAAVGADDIYPTIGDKGRWDGIVATVVDLPKFFSSFEIVGDDPRPAVNDNLSGAIVFVNEGRSPASFANVFA